MMQPYAGRAASGKVRTLVEDRDAQGKCAATGSMKSGAFARWRKLILTPFALGTQHVELIMQAESSSLAAVQRNGSENELALQGFARQKSLLLAGDLGSILATASFCS